MNEKNKRNELQDRLLDRVIGEIRDQPVPAFPNPPFEEDKVELAEKTRITKNRITKTGLRRILMSRRFQVVAALATVIAFVVLLTVPSGTQSAFAQVQEAMQSVRNVSYRVLDIRGDGEPHITSAVCMSSGLTRGESQNSVQINDWNRKTQLRIDHQKKHATFQEIAPGPDYEIHHLKMLEFFTDIPANSTRQIGQKMFNGKLVDEFMVPLNGREFNVLVDAETKLPIRMEYKTMIGNEPFREVFQDFVFDAELDPALFALEVPEGYTQEIITIGDAPPAGEVLVVSPTTGVGPLAFGSTREQIVELLGEPNRVREHSDTFPGQEGVFKSERLHYDARGLSLFVTEQYGLSSFDCLSQARTGPTVRDFTGQTPEGLKIGSSREEVIAALGQPESTHADSKRNGNSHYIRKGWQFSFVDDKVVGIDISQPVSNQFEIEAFEDGSFSIASPDEESSDDGDDDSNQ